MCNPEGELVHIEKPQSKRKVTFGDLDIGSVSKVKKEIEKRKITFINQLKAETTGANAIGNSQDIQDGFDQFISEVNDICRQEFVYLLRLIIKLN